MRSGSDLFLIFAISHPLDSHLLFLPLSYSLLSFGGSLSVIVILACLSASVSHSVSLGLSLLAFFSSALVFSLPSRPCPRPLFGRSECRVLHSH